MSTPFTTVADVLAELDCLAELHTARDQAHAEAAAAASARRPASDADQLEKEQVDGN